MNCAPFALPQGTLLYVVFLDENGNPVAFRAEYDEIAKQLVFSTDMTGKFIIVGLDYDGVEFSDDFYEKLAASEGMSALTRIANS